MAKIKHPLLHLPVDRDTPVPEVIITCRQIILKYTGNTWVPNPSPTVAVYEADVDALEAAEVDAKNGGKGMADARNGKLATVFTDMDALCALAQIAVDANLQKAAEIAAACGMVLKRTTRAQKAAIAAKMTSTPGKVKLMAKAAKRGACYAWEISMDGGRTWVTLGTSTVANTTVPGLTVGSTYLFRVCSTIGQTTGAWVQTMPFIVHGG